MEPIPKRLRSSNSRPEATVRTRVLADGANSGVVDPVDRARAAFADKEWGEAHRLFVALAAEDGGGLALDDLDRFATASYLSGSDEEAFEIWARGQKRCLAEGEIALAARFGIRAAQGLGFKGDFARSRGWVDRTHRVLDNAGLDCVEQGFLQHASALHSIVETGDVETALQFFADAGAVGDRFDDVELITLARIGTGRCLIYLGEVPEGIALLDEAMISVEAGEVPPLSSGDAYCTVIDACHELFDVRRCTAWTESFSRWCDTQPDLVLYRGHCLLHRAEVMLVQGGWADAAEEARRACERLADPIHPFTLAGANYLEAELHRLRGDVAAAEASYRHANELGANPHPGLALLRLAEGRSEVAQTSIRRVLAEAEGQIDRARMLGPYAEIMLACGDIEAALVAADELATVAAELRAPFLRATADTRGVPHISRWESLAKRCVNFGRPGTSGPKSGCPTRQPEPALSLRTRARP